MRLPELPHDTPATVLEVENAAAVDPIAGRLRELGFVAGEDVQVTAAGPFGAEPLLVQVGYTRFALRREEAARVLLASPGEAVNAAPAAGAADRQAGGAAA